MKIQGLYLKIMKTLLENPKQNIFILCQNLKLNKIRQQPKKA
jgi:hypothetical protein